MYPQANLHFMLSQALVLSVLPHSSFSCVDRRKCRDGVFSFNITNPVGPSATVYVVVGGLQQRPWQAGVATQVDSVLVVLSTEP